MSNIGVIIFKYENKEEQITQKIEKDLGEGLKVYHETITRHRKENDQEIFDRINEHLKNNNLKVINIESIHTSIFRLDGDLGIVSNDPIYYKNKPMKYSSNSNEITGYRIFYSSQ